MADQTTAIVLRPNTDLTPQGFTPQGSPIYMSPPILDYGESREREPRKPRQRATGAKKGGRPKKNSFRGLVARTRARLSGRKYGSKKKKAEVALVARKNGNNCTLSIGASLLAVVVGASAAFFADLALQRFATKSKPIRVAVGLGLGLILWYFGGRTVNAALGHALKLAAATSTLTGVVLVGIDTINDAAK